MMKDMPARPGFSNNGSKDKASIDLTDEDKSWCREREREEEGGRERGREGWMDGWAVHL